jgi:hypothetical protein
MTMKMKKVVSSWCFGAIPWLTWYFVFIADEDFAPNESGSDVAEEYDSDAQGPSDDGSDED